MCSVGKFRYFLLIALVVLQCASILRAQSDTNAAKSAQASDQRDGRNDFDFELGSWKIHLKKLLHPLTGSKEWVEFDGTSVTRKVWDSGSQIERFETDGAIGHLEGLTLRVYRPEAHQWYLYWANGKDGVL